jgi:hypothetical protein
MTQSPPGRAASWLPLTIRLTGISGLPPLLARLFDWREGGDAVAVMFSTVYVVWALFLFRSAKAPLANGLFLDFNITANSAHFGVMLLMAVGVHAQHGHLPGVQPAAVTSTLR